MSENKNIYKKVKLQSPIAAIIMLYISGVALFLTILAAVSIIIMNINTSDTMMQIYIITDAAVVAFIISAISCFVFQSKKLIYGMIVSVLIGISEFLLLVSLNNVNMNASIYVMIPAVIVFAFAGCVCGCNIGPRHKKRRLN